MTQLPKKVAVIGLDCALPKLIEKHIDEGHLPTFKKLIENGVLAENCMVPYPTITPPNWASIATGAWPGTHGITDFHMHKKGTTPDNTQIVQSFSSERCQAEFIWDAADKVGKRCIVLNYPGSWPSKMKNGIVVGGSGLSIGENRDGLTAMFGRAHFSMDMLITNDIYPRAIRGIFQDAKGWRNLPNDDKDPLELEAKMEFRDPAVPPAAITWYVLAHQSGENGYDSITLAPKKDTSSAFCTIKVGQWSPRINTSVRMQDGSEKDIFFRCKLIELTDDAEKFRLYISAIGTSSGLCNPPEVAQELMSTEGIVGHQAGVLAYALEWIDQDTFVEINELYTQYLTGIATTLLSKHEWDLFFMHAHSPDWIYHMLLTEMDPELTKDDNVRKAAWNAHLRTYQAQDKMISAILQACDKETLVILVSDHGAVADGPNVDLYKILEPAGLSMLPQEKVDFANIPGITVRAQGFMQELRTHFQVPDHNKSKCFPQRTCYIYINLKGRDPQGIVDPQDYQVVQQQIIDALLTYVEPTTGKRPVALALSKEDARILGLWGENIGDVVYALYPWFGGQHGNILPAAEWGIGSLKALLTFTGPAIAKGNRMTRTCNLIDIVPTICYVLNLPIPAQAEGAVLYQIFENPNFKLDNAVKG